MPQPDRFDALLLALQGRLLGAVGGPLPDTASRLHADLKNLLVGFSNDRLITNAPYDVHRLVKRTEASAGCVALAVCLPANFRRDPSLPHLSRDDGAWFDFHMLVRECARGPVELLAYGFEVRFGERAGTPAWVRFDFNPPEHENERRGVRSHLHPATDDWSIPSPVLTPIEALSIIVLGMRASDPERPRGVES